MRLPTIGANDFFGSRFTVRDSRFRRDDMKVWTTAATTLTLLSGVAIGAAVAPVANGQDKQENFRWAEPMAAQLVRGGGRLGVAVSDADGEDAKRAKLPGVGGVVIDEVHEGSPAEKAGLKTGDVVVEFDGERVRSSRQFARLVQETPPDREVQTIVVRDGQRMTLTVRTRASDSFDSFRGFEDFGNFRIVPPPMPPKPPTAPRAVKPLEIFPRLEGFFGSSGRLGITVDTLTGQLAEYFGAKEGVLVTSVTANSAAGKAGLKAGDVITGINGSAVDSPSDLTSRVQRLDDGGDFTLEIVRDKKAMTLKGKVEPRQERRWTTRAII
jgi:serine protease Do